MEVLSVEACVHCFAINLLYHILVMLFLGILVVHRLKDKSAILIDLRHELILLLDLGDMLDHFFLSLVLVTDLIFHKLLESAYLLLPIVLGCSTVRHHY